MSSSILTSIFISTGGLLLTGIGVFLTIRQRKYPGRITFVQDACALSSGFLDIFVNPDVRMAVS